jgi:RNA ligase
MAKITEVFGYEANRRIAEAVAAGLITERKHPAYPELRILNYTPKAAYEGAWDDITLNSRGLIYNAMTNEVVARPFRKFFNYGQIEAPAIAPGAKVYHVGDKFDGSLGIIYMQPNGVLAVATRGSFESEQAKHATAWLRRQDNNGYYADVLESIVSWQHTPLVEIIYPENRIVLDYEQQDYLEPLGWIEISTGAYRPPIPFHYQTTFGEVLAREPRPNSEGWVVWLDPYTAVKLKQDDYIALHKVVTGLSEKTVWEIVKQDDVVKWVEFLAALPDELQPWAKQIGDEIQHAVYDMEKFLYEQYDRVVDLAWSQVDGQPEMHDTIPRKNFALSVQQYIDPAYRSFMFSIADGKSIIPKLFDLFKPEGVGSRPGAVTRALEDA